MPRKPRHRASLHDADLVAALHRRGVSAAEAHRFLATFATVASELLAEGEILYLHLFGSFRARVYPATVGFDPRTARPLGFPARTRVIFRASTALLDALNRRRRRRRLGHA